MACISATYMSFGHKPNRYYFKDTSAFQTIQSWVATLFIFLSPSIQGFVDAYVFFDSRLRCCRIFDRLDMQRLSAEDGELDRTGSSVMIGNELDISHILYTIFKPNHFDRM